MNDERWMCNVLTVKALQNLLLWFLKNFQLSNSCRWNTPLSIWPEKRTFEPKLSKKIMEQNPKNPLEGITLEAIVTQLVEHYGFENLGERIKIKSFTEDPSIKSSLTFLRKTPWARKKVEDLYLWNVRKGFIRWGSAEYWVQSIE